MTTLLQFEGRSPSVDATAWLAPGVVLTGAVRVAERANLWFGVVARGDEEPIEIGPRCNVQDGVILHTDAGFPLVLEEDVAVGHGAIVHGATVRPGALIGMAATVLSGAEIGEGAVVAAGAVVKEGAQIPPRTLVVGVPAREVGVVDGTAGRETCAEYMRRAERYRGASR
jgi:carbonic anhydrase/acetyltransferase-like protein (isoleucine patch superfamily)